MIRAGLKPQEEVMGLRLNTMLNVHLNFPEPMFQLLFKFHDPSNRKINREKKNRRGKERMSIEAGRGEKKDIEEKLGKMFSGKSVEMM